MISMQIQAINNTISNNLYTTSMQNGKITLTKSNASTINETSEVCVVYNGSQSSDVQLYISSIDNKI